LGVGTIADDRAGNELNLRGIRIVETRLQNLLGEVSADEATRLLALELSEVDEGLDLVGSLAAVGAVGVILLSQNLGVEPHTVLNQLRTVMAPTNSAG
jgi:hypothetical protein